MQPTATLQEARDHVREHADEGVTCPCCDRYVRVYRRTITKSQVEFLVDLLYAARAHARRDGRPVGHVYVDVRTIQGQHMRGGDYSKLAYWGLIERSTAEQGYWRITPLGRSWLRGTVVVPRYAYVLDGVVQRFSTDGLGVDDARREVFDLDKLLSQRELTGAPIGKAAYG